MARNESTSHETRLWTIWSLLLGASCLSVAAGNTDAIVIPRMELVLPGVVYSVASVWRIYYGARQPVWNDSRLRAFSAIGFFATAVFASIEMLGTFVLNYVTVSDNTVAFNTAMGDLQPPCSVLAVTCWTLFTLYQNTHLVNEKERRVQTVVLSSFIGLLWALMAYFIGTSALDGLEKALNCLTGGITCFAAAFLVQSAARKTKVPKTAQPSSRAGNKEYEELLRKHAKRELSDREFIVLLATANGKTAKQIADDLGISIATVGSYRTRGYEKLGVRGKKGLVNLLALHRAEGLSPHEKLADDLPREDAGPILPNTPFFFLAQTATIGCLLVYIAYGPINHWYQSTTDDWVLSYWQPVIELLITSALVILSAIMTIRNLSSGDYDYALSPLKDLTISRMGYVALILDVAAAGYLLSEMTSIFDFRSGGISIIGLAAALFFIGLTMSPDNQKPSFVSFPRCICFGFKVSVLYCPEVFGLFALSALFWVDTTSSWLIFFPDSWQPLTMICTFTIALFVITVYFKFQGAASEATALPPTSEKRLISYLLGRGLSNLQADVISLTLQGEATEDICKRLSIAPGTVGSYRSRAYAMLGVRDLNELRELLIREAHIPS